MKKLIVTLMMVAMVFVLFGCGQGAAPAADPAPPAEAPAAEAPAEDAPEADAPAAEPAATGEVFNVGITLQSLQNPYWAGVFGHVDRIMTEKGWDFAILDAMDSSATQISHVEGFITAGVDLIMIHPVDPHAIEEVARQALDAGILLMSWDDILENSTLNWVLDNEELGFKIAEPAAHFINEHYSADNPAQVVIFGYPMVPILLERELGMVRALEEIAGGNFEIVASQPAIEVAPAMAHMETILQAHPDARVVVTIGAGSDIGANEVFMTVTGGDIPDDMGIFSGDATLQQLEAIMNGEATRSTVGFEGSSLRTAIAVTDLYEALLTGQDLPRNMVRVKTPMNIDNAMEFIADYR